MSPILPLQRHARASTKNHKSSCVVVSLSRIRWTAPCRPLRPARRLCALPANVAAGRPPPSCTPPTTSSPRVTKASSLSNPSSSLPNILAGLSSTALLGAAAAHFGADPDHASALATAAATAVAPLKEFGPADVIAQSFGPARPLWSALLHSPSHYHAAASTAHSWSLATGGGDHATPATSLISEARTTVNGLCDSYNKWLKESPLICKIITGNFFTVAGDMLAQLGLGGGGGHGGCDEVQQQQLQAGGGRRRVDWMRTGRLCLETSAIGTPTGHWWFNLLDSSIMPDNPHCAAAVMTKMLADQILFAPFGLALFFVVIKCLEGRPRNIPETLRNSYVKTLLGGYLLWPLAGILNFALLPNEYRLLFNNCVNIIWTCFLSIMSSGGANKKDAPASASVNARVADADPSSTLASHGALEPAIETAVLLAIVGAAVSGRPGFGYTTGLAVAALEAALSAACATAAAEPAPVLVSVSHAAAPVTVPYMPSPVATAAAALSFAAGGSVSIGGPCLELCEQPVDALYETR